MLRVLLPVLGAELSGVPLTCDHGWCVWHSTTSLQYLNVTMCPDISEENVVFLSNTRQDIEIIRYAIPQPALSRVSERAH